MNETNEYWKEATLGRHLRCAVLLGSIFLCWMISATEPFPEGTSSALLTVRLHNEGAGSLSAELTNDRRFTLEEVRKGGGVLLAQGIRFSSSSDADGLLIQADNRPVVVIAEGMGGCSALLGPGVQASFKVSFDRQHLSLLTPQSNVRPALLRFADGGNAKVDPGSSAHFDLLKDNSYIVSGDGQVTACSADGATFTLSPGRPPMIGGPLVSALGSQGEKRLERRSPLTRVRIDGDPGKPLLAEVGNQMIQLSASGPQDFVLPNGSELRLEQQGVPGELLWQVKKGCFRFNIEGARGWTALGLSGQSASMIWDQKSQTLCFSNTSSDGSVLVSLPDQTFARVDARSALQFRKISPVTFITAAVRGTVVLVHTTAEKETELAPGHLTLEPAQPKSGPTEGFENLATVTWQSDSNFVASSAAERIVLPPSSDKLLSGPQAGKVAVRSGRPGEITLVALAGAWTIRLNSTERVAIELVEGDGVALQASPNQPDLCARALKENVFPITFTVENEISYAIHAGDAITLSGPLLSWAGLVRFHSVSSKRSEPAGTAAPEPLGNIQPTGAAGSWNFGRYESQLYDEEISQPPVSVVR